MARGGSVPYDDETSLQEFLKYLFSKVKEYMAFFKKSNGKQ